MKPIFIAIAVISTFTVIVSFSSASVAGVPIFLACVALAMLIQWFAFVPAYLQQTEKFYDLTGSLSFIVTVAAALILAGQYDVRSLLLASLVILWAVRLGSFLVARIHQDGGDDRFDKIKPHPKRFFLTWTLQGLWVSITASTAIAAMSSTEVVELSLYDLNAVIIWMIGFGIEVVADAQKRRFRERNGSDTFITEGLWAYSRHPNYFGEIVLWIGIALLAIPALQGSAYLTLLSPVFVFVLLTRISGIPMLEKKADAKWGQSDAYQAYKAKTPLLVPFVR